MAHVDRAIVRVGPQGRVVIPAALRRQVGLSAGDELRVFVDADRLVLEPRAAAAERARGMFKHLATDVLASDRLIAERHAEAALDED